MAHRTCTVTPCDKPAVARGFCPTHWAAWRRTVPGPLPPRPTACAVDGCERGGKLRRGWCEPHYDRWQKHGDPAWEPPTASERFWAQVDGTGDCWIWTGWSGDDGYGRFAKMGVHRFVWEDLVGLIPAGMVIDHLCFVKLCVNPAHLEVVTQAENCRRSAIRMYPRGLWVNRAAA